MNICQKCSIEFEPTSWTKKICYNCRCKITSETTKKAMTPEINKKISNATKIAMCKPEVRKKFLDAMIERKVERKILICIKCKHEFEVTDCKLNRKYCSTNCYYKDKKPPSNETRKKISISNSKVDKEIKHNAALKAWKTKKINDPDNLKMKEVAIKVWRTRKRNGTNKHSNETKQKMSEAAKRNMINETNIFSKMYKKDTKPELAFEKILQERHIEYQKQFKLCHKFYDFYLPHKNLLVEIQGDYWHNIEKVKIKDKFKKELAKKYGYSLAVIWEHNLVKN